MEQLRVLRAIRFKRLNLSWTQHFSTMFWFFRMCSNYIIKGSRHAAARYSFFTSMEVLICNPFVNKSLSTRWNVWTRCSVFSMKLGRWQGKFPFYFWRTIINDVLKTEPAVNVFSIQIWASRTILASRKIYVTFQNNSNWTKI